MTERASHIQIVVFRVAGEYFALPTETAREVVKYEQPRRLPGSDAWVRGVINLRGEIIPVIDLPSALGLPGAAGIPTKTVICDAGAGSVGILVDDVAAVRTISTTDLVEHARRTHPALAGVLRLGDELVVFLDLTALLSPSPSIFPTQARGEAA